MRLSNSKHHSEPGTSGGAPAPAAPAGVQWDSFVDDLPGDERGVEPVAAPVAEPDSPTAPAQPAASPVAAPAQPAEPAAPAPQPQKPVVPMQTPEEQAAAVKAARDAMHAELTRVYETDLSEDARNELLSNPAAVMPKLLAQAAMDGANLAIRHLTSIMPQVVVSTTQAEKARDGVWSEFHAAGNEDLAKPEYRQAVLSAAHAIKALGKPLSKEEAFRLVGSTARSMLGIEAPSAAPAAPGARPTTPGSAPVAPFTPVARGHARPAAPAKADPKDSKWADLAKTDE